MNRARPLVLLSFAPLGLCCLALAACGSSGSGNDTDSGSGNGADMAASPDMAAGQCQMKDPPCTDNQIQELSLFKKASTRKITNAADGNTPGAWMSTVDATGGGFTPTESYVYAKFTDTGLMKVDVGDETAFTSAEWDIAFRRFIIRLNSGVGGPGCVTASETSGAYDDVKSLPGGLDFQPEAYYDDKCAMVDDKSGLGTPDTLLSSFWVYNGCVKMTNQVYVIRLADGRNVKLTVVGYYNPTVQETCNTTDTVPANAVGGSVRVRWQVLP